MKPAKAQNVAYMTVKATIPSDLYLALEQQCRDGQTVDQLAADRLAETADFNALKPIYINDDHRQQLDRVLGRNHTTPEELLHSVTRLSAVSVAGVQVDLHPRLLTRLRSRCFGKPFPKFLADLIMEELERFAGMR